MQVWQCGGFAKQIAGALTLQSSVLCRTRQIAPRY